MGETVYNKFMDQQLRGIFKKNRNDEGEGEGGII